MARRTKDELLAELRRLGALHDAWRDHRTTHGPPSERLGVMRQRFEDKAS